MKNFSRNVLITGGEHSDRINYANRFIKLQMCEKPFGGKACGSCTNCSRANHPNVIYIEPESSEGLEGESRGTIKIDAIRRILTENQKANFENGLGIFLITHMHQATKSAANALLKALEENHKNKAFIALSPSRMTVLPTIASRMICHVVEPAPLPVSCHIDLKKRIFDISSVAPRDRFSLCQGFNTERDALISELDNLKSACHILLRQKDIPARFALVLSSAIDQAQKELKKNLNPRLVVEELVLNLWPQLHI